MVLEVYPITKHQGMNDTGFVKNWWAGVETLTTLFIKEHNYLCGQLREVPIAPLVLDMCTVSYYSGSADLRMHTSLHGCRTCMSMA